MNLEQEIDYWREGEEEEDFRGPQIAGIDYSLASPAIAIHPIKVWAWDPSRVQIVFFGKEFQVFFHKSGMEFIQVGRADWKNDVDRYIKNAAPLISRIERRFVVEGAIEGYAYGATGKVFQIGENAGCLKTLLYTRLLLAFDSVAPTIIKRYATGSGRADKTQMHEAFLSETGINLLNRFSPKGKKKKIDSPISDIVDAYYICKWKWHNNNITNNSSTER